MLGLARARVRLKVLSPTTSTIRTFSFRPSSPNPSPLDWIPSSLSLSNLPFFRTSAQNDREASWLPRVPFTGPTESIKEETFDQLLPLEQIRRCLNLPVPTTYERLRDSRLDALFFGGHALKLLPEQEERDFLAAYHHERLEFVGDRLWGEVVSQVVFLLAPATGSNLQTLHEETTHLCTNEMAARLAHSVKLEMTRGVTLDNDDAADRFEAYLAALFFANGRRALLSFLVPLVQREFFSKFNVVPVLEMSTTATSYGPSPSLPVLGLCKTYGEAVERFKNLLFKERYENSLSVKVALRADGYHPISGIRKDIYFAYKAMLSDAVNRGWIEIVPDQPSQRSNLSLRYQSQEQLDAHVIHDLIRLSSRLTKFSFTHLWQLEIPGFPPISAKGPAARGPHVYRDLVKQCCFAKLIIVEDQESFDNDVFVKKVPSARGTTSSSRSTSEESAPQLSKSPSAKSPSSSIPTPSSLSSEEAAGIRARQNEDVQESPTSLLTSIASGPKETPLDDWETVKARSGGWVFKSKTDMLRRFNPSNLAASLQFPSRLKFYIACTIDGQALSAEGNTRTKAIENLFFAAVKSETLPNSKEGREKLNHRLCRFRKGVKIRCSLKLGNGDHLVQVARPMKIKQTILWKDFVKKCVARGIVHYPGSKHFSTESGFNVEPISSALPSGPSSLSQNDAFDFQAPSPIQPTTPSPAVSRPSLGSNSTPSSEEESTTKTHLLSIPSTPSTESSLDGNPSSVPGRTEDDSASSEFETAPCEPISSIDSVSAPTCLSSPSVSSTAPTTSSKSEEALPESFHETERSGTASSTAPASTMTSAIENISDHATAPPTSSELSLEVARSPEEELTTALAENEESVTLADTSTSEPRNDDPPSPSTQSPNSHPSELSKGGSSALLTDKSTTSLSLISTTDTSREEQSRVEEEPDVAEEEEEEPESRPNFPRTSDLEWTPVPSSAVTISPPLLDSDNVTYEPPPPIQVSSMQDSWEKAKVIGGAFRFRVTIVLPGYGTIGVTRDKAWTTQRTVCDWMIYYGALTRDSSKPEQSETLPFNLMNPNHDILHRLGKLCQRNPDNKLTWKWTLSIPGYPTLILNDDGLGMKRLRSRILFAEAVKAGIFSLPDRTVNHNSSPSPSPTTTKSSTVPAEQSKKPTSFLDSLAEEAS